RLITSRPEIAKNLAIAVQLTTGSDMSITMNKRTLLLGNAVLLSLAMQSVATADPGEADTAKLAQNPVASIISLPFQYNGNLNFGPQREPLDVLNVQPVIPFSLTKDWNLITRTIVPLVSAPASTAGESRFNGVGDVLFTAFLSPTHPGNWIWGVGPA